SVISIEIYAKDAQVHAVLRNPYRESDDRHAGNRMAVANIRERLQLHFDAEATLTARTANEIYEVRIAMPYVKEGNA
ncbi:MAG TPA: histidine kinase, partial [Burkholderiales bacterium]